ncbi:flagellar assembly protein FliW [Zhaonella formicivorans]|uniref:flagellar assembly protein FliW n=1 Tax=Zhaonella formicivorans TaxID=2528593 RepID=UPI0010EB0F02|nr:flagellar assembly protein FliW [Zhaonella formicivorans]
MQIYNRQLGEVEVLPQDVYAFEEGLPGFETLQKFALLPFAGSPYFHWLLSLEDSNVGFLTVDPFPFFPGYHVDLGEELLQKLKITDRRQVAVYNILTVPESVALTTANLAGPLVFNLQHKLAKQVILDNSKYHTKHQLFTTRQAASESR